MDPQLTVFVGTLLALLVLTVAVAMRVRHNRERSMARVAVLQELVAEYSDSPGPLARRRLGEGRPGPPGPSGASCSRVSAEALAQAEVFGLSATSEFDDDWDLWLRVEDRDDTPDYADTSVQDYADEQDSVDRPLPAAPSIRTVAMTSQFVVHVPDSGAQRWQVSFKQSESES